MCVVPQGSEAAMQITLKTRSSPMARGQSLQDPFLNALRKERVPVSIYLVNGIKLQGQIDSFDQFVVLLRNSVSQMVYKHAISTVVLVDQTLTPSQERNLEKLTNRRVLDRNGLILDIFAQRARSFEGKLQVELAQLSHLASRLVRGWTHLERQKGGIGLRGPGETDAADDRRLIGKRIR